MRILLTGATGLIGSQLGITLVRLGHDLTTLTRKGSSLDVPFPCRCLAWDHRSTIDQQKLDPEGLGFDAVIHLAGEPVAQRWTAKVKQRIYDSRVLSTKALIASIKNLTHHPKTWINASAIGIYGSSPTDTTTKSFFNEDSPAGEGFLANVGRDWEKSAFEVGDRSRLVFCRFGVVLSQEGGALPEMMNPFYYGIGGPIGHGKQQLSWIHIDDAVQAVIHCLINTDLRGPVNVVAPEPVSNKELSTCLGAAMGMPSALPVPKFVLRLVFGEMSQMLTESLAVVPKALLSSGFKFKYSTPQAALKSLISPSAPRGARVYIARQWLKGTPSENFPFFSAAENLEKITPPWLNFKITKKSSPEMKSGLLIDYRLRVKGIPISWRTRIENWDPPHKFVDTQLKGPYNTWHHTHSFETLGEGTLMTDRVIYKIRFWPFGDVALPMVKKDVQTIFAYRKTQLGG